MRVITYKPGANVLSKIEGREKVTKIQLDHKALRGFIELLGPDFELEIRHAILEAAVRRRIKALVPAEVEKVVDARIKMAIEEQVGQILREGLNGYRVKLNPLLEEAIRAKVDMAVAKVIPLNESDLLDRCRVRADRVAEDYERHFEHNLKRELAERLSSLAKAKVAEILQGGKEDER